MENREKNYEKVKTIKRKNEKALLHLKNVVGVGIGGKIVDGKATEEFCIRVYVRKKMSRDKLLKKDIIPKTVEGVRTDVIEVGDVFPYVYDSKHRPAHGGDSVGHFAITAGTIGNVFRDKTDGKKVILSNNHILANRDTDQTNRASVGDCITQPGPSDGGTCASDSIATLKRWVEFVENGNTKVDAAIAELINQNDVVDEIHDIGCVSSWRAITVADVVTNPAAPDNVQKTGRTTQYTTGKIVDDDATFWNGDTYLTENIVTNDMAYYGDSGSLLLDMDKKAVGLLWGGSPGYQVYYSRIENVLDALNIEFYPCVHIRECLIGPRPPCLTGGPVHKVHCKIGGPDVPDIGVVHCTIGGPDVPDIGVVHCTIGGPDVPEGVRCSGAGPMILCLACGPDSPIRCSVGGPEDLVDVLGCKTGPHLGGPTREVIWGPGIGPGLIISIIDDKVNPKDIIILDKTKIPKGMQKAIMKMLEEMAGYR